MGVFSPVAVDSFSRFMVEMFDEKDIISVPTAFQAFFGNPAAGGQTVFSENSNDVDIDIIRGNERTSALIPRGMISRPLGALQKNLNVENYSSFSRKYPLAEEEGDITADQILQRVAGENPYQALDRQSRMRILGLKIHLESIRRIVRMNEILAAQSVIEGIQDAIIGTTNTDLQYDFKRNAALTVTPANTWNSGSQDILGDIDGMCTLLRAHGKMNPNFMGLGTDAMDAFIKDTTVATQADNRRFELIEVSTNNPVPPEFTRFTDAGWIARGRLRTPAGHVLWMFTMLDVYDNTAGTSTPFMPVDKVIITNVKARADRYFGPPENLPMIGQRIQLYQEFFGFNPEAAPMPPNIKSPGGIIMPAMFHSDAYVSSDWKKITVRTQHAPIFATTQTDSFGTLEGLIT